MSMRWVKVCTLTAVFAGVFGASSSFAADDKKPDGMKEVPAAQAPAPAPTTGVVTGNCGGAVVSAPSGAGCGPVYQTIKVTEMVPTTVAETRTVYKNEMRTESFTAYRNEIVAEQQTHNVTVNRMVSETVMEARSSWVSKPVTTMETRTSWVSKPVTTMETRTVTEKVPVTKTITVNETHYTTESVTEMKSKTVHKWVSVPVTKEMPSCGLGLFSRFHSGSSASADPCNPCATSCSVPCPKTITYCKKERVCETVCEPVTVCKKVAHCVPVCKTVCSYECVTKQIQCPVTTCVKECVTTQCPVTRCVKECVTTMVPVCKTKCVSEVVAKTCTVNVCKSVPYEATRTICVPVATQETVNVCKMVPTIVEKQVLVSNGNGCGNGCGSADPCGNGCGSADACSTGCGMKGFGLKDKLCGFGSGLKDKVGGAFSKIRSIGCRKSCTPTCDLGCGAPAAPSCSGCGH